MQPGWLSGSCGQNDDDFIGSAERALMRNHLPDRPLWICLADGDPWPCAVARVTLAAEYHADKLRDVMIRFLYQAIPELRGLDQANRFERFLKWMPAEVARVRAADSRQVWRLDQRARPAADCRGRHRTGPGSE